MDPRAARFDPPAEPVVTPANAPETAPSALDLSSLPALVPASPAAADVAWLGVGFDGTSGRRPMQRHGPGLFRAALTDLSPTPQEGQATLGVHEGGDVRVHPLDTSILDTRVQGALGQLAAQAPDALAVLLGGEHTISLPAVRALEPASIVSLDAHTDLWRETNGRTIAHSTWLFHARDALGCPVALPLTRTTRGEAEEIVQEPDVHLDLPTDLPEPVYLSIDVDVFDPDDAPAVVFPERGGPTPVEVLDVIREVCSRYTVCGIDVVELNANRLGPTAHLGAAALATAMATATDP